MKILLTGGKGQLGRALQRALSENEIIITDLEEMDITDQGAVTTFLSQEMPEIVIHCAAMTDVDGCARNPGLAYQINGLGTHNIALSCRAIGARMVHISTNEVFAGDRPTGYEEWMPVSPINPYGRTKAAAENFVRALLTDYYIVRTAWLYGPGGRNFIHAILDRARRFGEVQVVTDEVGNPTLVDDLANGIALLIGTEQYGIYHLTNKGACSRWSFANEILRLAGLESVVNRPILTADFQRASNPPPFGELLNFSAAALDITLPTWQDALARYMDESAR